MPLKRSCNRERIQILAFIVLQAILLTTVAGSWWAGRNNNLFGNGRWIAGKNTCKFVFYTYEFMLSPLKETGLDLTSSMGFQEILYKKPDSADRTFSGLKCKTRIDNGAYLWVEIHKKGNSFLGFRVSRSANSPGGIYRFNDSGEIVESWALSGDLPPLTKDWQPLEVNLVDNVWNLSYGEVSLGSCSNEGFQGGHFGFRGSGRLHAHVLLGDITMKFADPSSPGRTWTEHEDFTANIKRPAFWMWAFIFSAGVLILYRWRLLLLREWIPHARREAFVLADDITVTAFLAVLFVYPGPTSGVLIPALVFLMALTEVAMAGWCARGGTGREKSRAGLRGIFHVLFLCALFFTAFAINGPWLWRTERHGPRALKMAHPSTYIHLPHQGKSSESLVISSPVQIIPGRPMLSGTKVYRDQVITADFIMSPDCTVDAVFQQQAFQTPGDVDGEPLPYARRLLRLTTADNVPAGMAVGTGKNPAPFSMIKGEVKPDEVNHLTIRTDHRGVTIKINGQETHFGRLKPVGYGETGFIAYGGVVTLKNLTIRPVLAESINAKLIPWESMIFPWLLAVVAWILFAPGGSVTFGEAALLEFTALFPLAFYFLGSLFLTPEDLSFMGRDRIVWLDLLLGATALTHMAVVLILRNRIKRPAVIYNLLLMAFLVFMVLFSWDLLPPNHVLRLKFTTEAVAPGELIGRKDKKGSPWYSNMRSIGANVYPWKQQLGGENITAEKPEDEFRIFVLGGSQAWGSGAAASSETFTEILEGKLRAEGLPVRIYNGSVNGAGINKIDEFYRGILRQFNPDLIIADIGLNDSAALIRKRGQSREKAYKEFAAVFEKLVLACRDDGADMVLVLEPMCRETPLRPDRGYYDALKDVAWRNGVPALDPGALIRKKEKDHLVWWDTAHFAPYGHLLMAGFLEEPVEKVVRSRLASATR